MGAAILIGSTITLTAIFILCMVTAPTEEEYFKIEGHLHIDKKGNLIEV
jgi:hypothetical protein